MPNSQNFVSEGFFSARSVSSDQEEKILQEIQEKTGFVAKPKISSSSWWNSKKVGAVHYAGTFKNEPAILKIQLVKPNVSEASLITGFEKQNQSLRIRPPKLLASLPWNKAQEYEAIILEESDRNKPFTIPTTAEQIRHFFQLYREYKENCVTQPWLEKPNVSLGEATQKNFEKWGRIAEEIYPDHPARTPERLALITASVELLAREYQAVDWEFQHSHFSLTDLYQKNGQYILLSNLYWSWRAPYYDAVFGFQWYLYHLANTNNVTEKIIEEQTVLWQQEIAKLVKTHSQAEKKLLQLAELERATAGLNLDALTVQGKHAEYAITSTEARIKKLMTYFD